MSEPKKLQPVSNGATYPTLREARWGRGLLLAGIGAAALSIGVAACSPPDPPPGPVLGGVPALTDLDAGEVDAGQPPEGEVDAGQQLSGDPFP